MNITRGQFEQLTKELQKTILVATKKVLTFEEACIYTGISTSYMYRLTSEKRIPHFKPNGKFIFFKTEELEKWCLSNACKTQEETQREAATIIAMHKNVIAPKGKEKIKKAIAG